MVIIPHLAHACEACIITLSSDSRFRVVVSWPVAANVWQSAKALRQCALQLRERSCRSVRRLDARSSQPAPGRQSEEIRDRRLEEVKDVGVLWGQRSVARSVECREAGGVLGELVRPEHTVCLIKSDPVFVHESEKVVRAEGSDESVNARSCPGWDCSAICEACCGVWGWDGIVLSAVKQLLAY